MEGDVLLPTAVTRRGSCCCTVLGGGEGVRRRGAASSSQQRRRGAQPPAWHDTPRLSAWVIGGLSCSHRPLRCLPRADRPRPVQLLAGGPGWVAQTLPSSL